MQNWIKMLNVHFSIFAASRDPTQAFLPDFQHEVEKLHT